MTLSFGFKENNLFKQSSHTVYASGQTQGAACTALLAHAFK